MKRIIGFGLLVLLLAQGVSAGQIIDTDTRREYTEDFDAEPIGSVPADTWYAITTAGTGTTLVQTAPAGLSGRAWQITDSSVPFAAQLRNTADGVDMCGVGTTTGQTISFTGQLPDLALNAVWEYRVSGAAVSTSGGPANSFGVRATGLIGTTTNIVIYLRANTGSEVTSATGTIVGTGTFTVLFSQLNCAGTASVAYAITGVTGLSSNTLTVAAGNPITADMDRVTIANPSGAVGTTVWFDSYDWKEAPLPAPTITGITPNQGPTSGGQEVTVTGTGFSNFATFLLDGVEAENVVRVDSQTLTGETPPHAAAFVDVEVENADGQTAVLSNGYSYTSGIPGGDLFATIEDFEIFTTGSQPSRSYYAFESDRGVHSVQPCPGTGQCMSATGAGAAFTFHTSSDLCPIGGGAFEYDAYSMQTGGATGYYTLRIGDTLDANERFILVGSYDASPDGSGVQVRLTDNGPISVYPLVFNGITDHIKIQCNTTNIVVTNTVTGSVATVPGVFAAPVTDIQAGGDLSNGFCGCTHGAIGYWDNIVFATTGGPITADNTQPITDLTGFDVEPSGQTAMFRYNDGTHVRTMAAGTLTLGAVEQQTFCGTDDGFRDGVSTINGLNGHQFVAHYQCNNDSPYDIEQIRISDSQLGVPDEEQPAYCDTISEYCVSTLDEGEFDCNDDVPPCENLWEGLSDLQQYPYDYSKRVNPSSDTSADPILAAFAVSTQDGGMGVFTYTWVHNGDDKTDYARVTIDPSGGTPEQLCSATYQLANGNPQDAIYGFTQSGNVLGYHVNYAIQSGPTLHPTLSAFFTPGPEAAAPAGISCNNNRLLFGGLNGAVRLYTVGPGANQIVVRATTPDEPIKERGVAIDPSGFYGAYTTDDRITLFTIDGTTAVTKAYLDTPGGDIVKMELQTSGKNLWVATTSGVYLWQTAQYYETETVFCNLNTDTDNDGFINSQDSNIDGHIDNIPNNQDPDIDGDGIPNTSDTDDDGDGCPDSHDTNPGGGSGGAGGGGGIGDGAAQSTDNPLGAAIAFSSDAWGFDTTLLYGLAILLMILIVVGGVLGKSPILLGIAGFIGVAICFKLGLFPIWLLFVIIFIIIAVGSFALWATRGSSEGDSA